MGIEDLQKFFHTSFGKVHTDDSDEHVVSG
jgi:hypothetical protein